MPRETLKAANPVGQIVVAEFSRGSSPFSADMSTPLASNMLFVPNPVNTLMFTRFSRVVRYDTFICVDGLALVLFELRHFTDG